ncbi:YlmC/YmxH family sporulation protein [Clostridium akagii]|uniref:YlmC/YmxH family sporulation protein n=1 Tax=Clostridium akagii TaxID=91623 RepID=UPI000478BC74|nr:YlmC/YmxH family sporulation protein [Clostridium akagii]
MEEILHSLNRLKAMEVIDVSTGSKLGFIKDLVVDCDDYKIISILLPNQKLGWFSKSNDIEIPWQQINKVGVDVILVDCKDISYNKD